MLHYLSLICNVRFDIKLTFEACVSGAVSRVSLRISLLGMVSGVFAVASVLLLYYYAFILCVLLCWSEIYCNLSPSTFLAPCVFGGHTLS